MSTIPVKSNLNLENSQIISTRAENLTQLPPGTAETKGRLAYYEPDDVFVYDTGTGVGEYLNGWKLVDSTAVRVVSGLPTTLEPDILYADTSSDPATISYLDSDGVTVKTVGGGDVIFGALPGAGVAGKIYIDDTASPAQSYYWDGSAFQPIGSSGPQIINIDCQQVASASTTPTIAFSNLADGDGTPFFGQFLNYVNFPQTGNITAITVKVRANTAGNYSIFLTNGSTTSDPAPVSTVLEDVRFTFATPVPITAGDLLGVRLSNPAFVEMGTTPTDAVADLTISDNATNTTAPTDPRLEVEFENTSTNVTQYSVITYSDGTTRSFNRTTGAEEPVPAGATACDCDCIQADPLQVINIQCKREVSYGSPVERFSNILTNAGGTNNINGQEIVFANLPFSGNISRIRFFVGNKGAASDEAITVIHNGNTYTSEVATVQPLPETVNAFDFAIPFAVNTGDTITINIPDTLATSRSGGADNPDITFNTTLGPVPADPRFDIYTSVENIGDTYSLITYQDLSQKLFNRNDGSEVDISGGLPTNLSDC